jgi:hypothetical protein
MRDHHLVEPTTPTRLRDDEWRIDTMHTTLHRALQRRMA